MCVMLLMICSNCVYSVRVYFQRNYIYKIKQVSGCSLDGCVSEPGSITDGFLSSGTTRASALGSGITLTSLGTNQKPTKFPRVLL